ncbi:hypothetical protein [Novacetimonas pomaceti]|uniref:Uncharacterized protein n=1 Tax=Novacetimonas pomaceti TaxID=2021998 RepID=A0ABX5P3X5_9PROT|nr:hypothetical protein [Novacetimonas pomaceti]PYD48474.1 hypothetical protein C3920_04615 [Novacetimonas pomaceti]
MTITRQKEDLAIIAWPLILLALISRIAFGGVATPDDVLHPQTERLSLLSILCQGDMPPDDGHHDHHLPVGDTATLLTDAHGLDSPLSGEAGFSALGSGILISRLWIFPPVRGPPRARYCALCPQGPPHLS